MPERLGSAVLELRTDDSKFTRGVKGAESGARKLGRQLKKTGDRSRTLGFRLSVLGTRVRALGRSFFTLRNAAILVAGVTGLGLITKKALDTADAIAKTSDIIGLSTETLQKWTFAAGQSGVSSDNFVKGLKTFAKQIGEARVGTGTLVTILKNMNPALLENLTSAKNVEEAFLLMRSAIGKTENQMDKMALSAAAFGRGAGAAMIIVANDGGVAFDRWAERLVEAGGIIPEALTRNAESAKDELAFLTKIIGVQFTIAILKAAPEITRLAKLFSDAVPSIVEWIENIARIVTEFVEANPALSKWGLIVGAAVLALGPLVLAFGALVGGLALLGPALVVGGGFIAALSLPILGIIAALVATGAAFFVFGEEIIEALQPAIDFIKEFFGFGKKAVTSVTLDLDLPQEVTADTEKAVEAMDDLRSSISVFTDESIKQAARLRESTFQFEGGALKKFSDDGEDAIEAIDKFGAAISAFTDESIRQAARLRKSSFQFSGGALKKFAHGGSFPVGGMGGIDSQLVQFMATPGETVTVTPEGGGAGSTFNIDARGADLGVERRIQRAMQQAIKTARMQSGNDFAAALSGAGA